MMSLTQSIKLTNVVLTKQYVVHVYMHMKVAKWP